MRISEIGNVCLITPVDMTSITGGDDDDGLGEGGGARRASVARAMTHASARPLAAGDSIRAAAVDDEGARPRVCLRTSLQSRLECVAREEVERSTARSGSDGSFFNAAVYAAEEVAAREEVVWYRFVQVHFGWGGFGCEGRC